MNAQSATKDSSQAVVLRRNGWFESRSADRFVLARHWPARLDISAEAAFPRLGRARLARQIRQDLWRVLKDLRGFSPVIIIDATEPGLIVKAGGRVQTRRATPQDTAQLIAALLNDPAHRMRWSRWARIGGQA